MSGQVRNYQTTVQEVASILGDEDSAANYLSQCIFHVAIGGNDYLNNYFMPAFYTSGSQYTPEQWADLLIQEYSLQMRVSVLPKSYNINSTVVSFYATLLSALY